MLRYNDLFDRICSWDNLRLAFVKARKGKRTKENVQAYQSEVEVLLPQLREQMLTGTFTFGDYHRFTIYDPKERIICAARFEERIVHHAMMNVCGDILERALIDDCFACRAGKGQYKALERARGDLHRHSWCLKMDMSHYFDSIDHDIMLSKLERKFKDKPLMALWSQLIDSYQTEEGKGIPIGNLTSQYMANLYLDAFDRFATANKKRGYVRYMDDILIMGEHDDMKQLLKESKVFLADVLKLTLKHGGSLHRSERGVDFLGYRLFPDKLLLNRNSKCRFKRKLEQYWKDYSTGRLSEEQFQEHCTALFAFVEHAKTMNFRRRILAEKIGE